MAASGLPQAWQAVGVSLVLAMGGVAIVGHARQAFGPITTAVFALLVVPVGIALGDPFRATELLYVAIFHQALFRSWRSTVTVTLASLAALATSVLIGTWLLPAFTWDVFEVILQIPAILLIGVIHILGVSINLHERAAAREAALAEANSALARETSELNERLTQQAYHDPLTGLGNRLLIAEHARAALAVDATGTALLVLDLDSFKLVNDSLGHAAGDRMLVEVAERLRACLPPRHSQARLGGDEFAVLLRGLTDPQAEADTLANRVLEALRLPMALNGKDIAPEASVGIVVGAEGATIDTLLVEADLAMYAAKRAGKGRAIRYDASLRDAAIRKLELDLELRRALDAGEFELLYQPLISLSTGALSGLEALVRWRHPERGLVDAGAFVPHAEESGLIVPLGEWLLREACRQTREWHDRWPGRVPRVGVNLSARQLHGVDLEALITSALDDAELDGSALTLELTESSLFERTEATREALIQLRERGVGIGLDDFGTGYSSLAYLRDFPFHLVKIDRSFVKTVDTDVDQAAFVSGIIGMVQTLRMGVVAEGIETAAQLRQLQALGCNHGQGYHIAHPLPAWAIERDWLGHELRKAA